jgi:hypothetical protein
VSKPAGVQIRFWIIFLVCLLAVVDLTALTGSIVVTRSIRVVSERAAPVAATTASIRQEIMAAMGAVDAAEPMGQDPALQVLVLR